MLPPPWRSFAALQNVTRRKRHRRLPYAVEDLESHMSRILTTLRDLVLAMVRPQPVRELIPVRVDRRPRRR
jgi:hypothetical protein